MKKTTTQTVTNASEFYRGDLAHAVNTLGAVMRSLKRMGKIRYHSDVEAVFQNLEQELQELREKEKNDRERS
jgi:hypothetical protein